VYIAHATKVNFSIGDQLESLIRLRLNWTSKIYFTYLFISTEAKTTIHVTIRGHWQITAATQQVVERQGPTEHLLLPRQNIRQ